MTTQASILERGPRRLRQRLSQTPVVFCAAKIIVDLVTFLSTGRRDVERLTGQVCKQISKKSDELWAEFRAQLGNVAAPNEINHLEAEIAMQSGRCPTTPIVVN